MLTSTESDTHSSAAQHDSPCSFIPEQSIRYWSEQAQRIHWQSPFKSVARLVGDGPAQQWFPDGLTNMCYNAVDRHLAERADQTAMVYIDAEDNIDNISYRQLHERIQVMAAILQHFGIGKGDRVAIYLPMIPEAEAAMLACARIGAIHSVIFAGMPEHDVALRLKDVSPSLLITADGGLDGRHQQLYRPILKEAVAESGVDIPILMIDQGMDTTHPALPREQAFAPLRERFEGAQVPCEWISSQSPNHIIYTSGTTGGRPKGIVRDTGGYAVALNASLDSIYDAHPGDVIFTASNIGWALGHSYLVYAPLLAGLTTVMMEGGPLQTGSHRWWQLIEKAGITHMLTTPSAIRQIRQAGGKPAQGNDISCLRKVFLAGEPIDQPSADWLRGNSPATVIDHYWQTESGWPLLASDGETSGLLPVADRDIRVASEWIQDETGDMNTGSVVIERTLGPGAMLTLWENDHLFSQLYWTHEDGRWIYDTQDWATIDETGRITIRGRTDDVLKIGGQRIATADIEDIVKERTDILEAAIIPLENYLLGQVPGLCIVLAKGIGADHFNRDFREELRQDIKRRLGRRAVPRKIYLHQNLPKTPSGKIIRSKLIH